MNPLLGLLIVGLFVAGVVMLLRGGAASGRDAEKELLRLCRGDRDMMDRLIAHEQGRRHGRSREAAVKAAMDSLKRDNR